MYSHERSFDFTVLMSVYDRDDVTLFVRAIDSVYQNILQPMETILVVDGEVNSLLNDSIVRSTQKYGINCQRLKYNVGLRCALNYGLQFVRTAWVARADADDFNLPNRFSTQIELARKGFDLIGSFVQEVNTDGTLQKIRRLPCQHVSIVRFASRRNPFNHMSVMFRTELVGKCGGYPALYLREDYGLWALMIYNKAKLVNIDEVLVVATAGSGMINRRRGLSSALAEIRLQKHLNQCSIKNPCSAVVDCFLRGILLLLPTPLLSLLYNFMLRHK